MFQVAGELVAQPGESNLNLFGPTKGSLDVWKDILLTNVFHELGLLQELGRLTMGSA